ncbi:MAG TPA: DinB family protein [Acidimicrobiales bacterium]|jgi:hypothetical protein|nr:DinB family protein [Acidimicrobiales bacterium]
MPTPTSSGQAHAVSVVIAQFRQLHAELRQEVADSRDESLNWAPCPEANSAATIITHTLGSEAETLRAVAGAPAPRDRDAEFRMGVQTRAVLLDQIDAADALLDDLASELTDDRAAAPTTLPTLPRDDSRSGMTWLIGNLGHAREHVGHLRLTLQLFPISVKSEGH